MSFIVVVHMLEGQLKVRLSMLAIAGHFCSLELDSCICRLAGVLASGWARLGGAALGGV